MSEEEIEKMFKELTDPQVKERVKKALDYINIYPSTVTMKFPSKQSRRMKKIKNIFND
jgi:hypothetical protein